MVTVTVTMTYSWRGPLPSRAPLDSLLLHQHYLGKAVFIQRETAVLQFSWAEALRKSRV